MSFCFLEFRQCFLMFAILCVTADHICTILRSKPLPIMINTQADVYTSQKGSDTDELKQSRPVARGASPP